MKFSNKVYKNRGVILGGLAALLLWIPPSKETVSASAFILFFSGFILRVSARRNMGIHSRSSKVEAPALVKEGVYEMLRHPLYLSNGFFASGFLLFYLGWQDILFPIAALIWLFLFFLARNEDDFLKKKFGEEWESWAMKTPFMIPSLKGWKNLKFKRGFLEAFIEDKSTWFFLILYMGLMLIRRIFS